MLHVLGAGQNLKTAELLGEKIIIGVIYRQEKARCRELKKIFQEQLTEEDITAAQHEMKAYSFEGKAGHCV